LHDFFAIPALHINFLIDAAVRKSVVNSPTTKNDPQITLIFADYFKNDIKTIQKQSCVHLRNLRIITSRFPTEEQKANKKP
jgi:hypothetical protein